MTDREKVRLSLNSFVGNNPAVANPSGNARYKEYVETLQNDNISEIDLGILIENTIKHKSLSI